MSTDGLGSRVNKMDWEKKGKYAKSYYDLHTWCQILLKGWFPALHLISRVTCLKYPMLGQRYMYFITTWTF